MDILSNLKYAAGSKKDRKRVGRGVGSGHGKTATRGMNGQMSRSGASKKAWFEGGQMPLQRRIPKFGFTNIFKVSYQLVNVDQLQRLSDKFDNGVVNLESLKKAGLIKSTKKKVKILGNGTLNAKLTVEAEAFTNTAKEKIEAAGGSVKTI
jgi:large subunit ribosomal protein L15